MNQVFSVWARATAGWVVGAMHGACEGAGIAQILELGSRHLIESGALIELFPLFALFPSRHYQRAKVRALSIFAST